MIRFRILTESPSFIQRIQTAGSPADAKKTLNEVRGLMTFRFLLFGVNLIFFGALIYSSFALIPSYLAQHSLSGFWVFFVDYPIPSLIFVLVLFSFYKIASAAVLLFNYPQMKRLYFSRFPSEE